MQPKAKCLKTKGKIPLPRSGHKLVADDKYVYLIGGYVELDGGNEHDVRGEVWKLHIATNTWHELIFDHNYFQLAASHAAMKIGDCIFITGGTGVPFGVNILSHLVVLDTRRLTQRCLNFNPRSGLSRNLPIATYGHSMLAVTDDSCGQRGPSILIFGGTTGTTYHNQVYQVDLLTMESEMLHGGANNYHHSDYGTPGGDYHSNPGPSGRYKHQTFLYDKQVYLLGGTTASDCCPLDEVNIFDIKKRSWVIEKTSGNGPNPLRCPSMCQNEQLVYLSGGLSPQTISVSTHVYQLDLCSRQWTIIGVWSQQPAYFHDSVYLPGPASLLFIAGVTRSTPTQRRSNAVYQLQPPLCGPGMRSMREMAWNSLLQQCQLELAEDARAFANRLYQMGLPVSLLGRLAPELECLRQASFAA